MDKIQKYITIANELKKEEKKSFKEVSNRNVYNIEVKLLISVVSLLFLGFANIFAGIKFVETLFPNMLYYFIIVTMFLLNVVIGKVISNYVVKERENTSVMKSTCTIVKDLSLLYCVLSMTVFTIPEWYLLIYGILTFSTIIMFMILSLSVMSFGLGNGFKQNNLSKYKELSKERDDLGDEIINDKDCLTYLLQKAEKEPKFKNSFVYKELYENKIEPFFFDSKESMLLGHLKNNTNQLKQYIEND